MIKFGVKYLHLQSNYSCQVNIVSESIILTNCSEVEIVYNRSTPSSLKFTLVQYTLKCTLNSKMMTA